MKAGLMQRVMIFGEVLVDVFPEQTIIGGAPYNVARHLNAFNYDVSMLTAVGQDTNGERITREMHNHGLDCKGVQVIAHAPTGQVTVSFDAEEHHFEILDAQAYDALTWPPIQILLNQQPPQLAYIGTLALRHMPTMQVARQWLNQLSCPVFCDVNLRAPWFNAESLQLVLKHAHIVKINDEELPIVNALLNLSTSDNLQTQALALQKQFKLREVLVTCGEDGSWCLDANQQFTQAPIANANLAFVDSVGAGDAYSAMMIHGLLAGWSLPERLARASQFATDICGVRGAVPKEAGFYQAHLT
jgi:fructokinase